MKKYNFIYDVYISYANADNQPDATGKGWVDYFHHFLETILFQILGERPVFLRIAGNEKPHVESLQKCAVMVSVVSPEYLRHEACLEEIEDFANKAIAEGNYIIKGYERIFKAVKYPVEKHNQPLKLKPLLGYDLYYYNTETNEIHAYKDFFDSEAEQKFWLKMVDLAYDIADILRHIRMLDTEKTDLETYSEKHVYVAEVSPDVQMHRDSIKRELLRHGFHVFPDHDLPANPKEIQLTIKKYLERCRLSIHLVGDTLGAALDEEETSLEELQNTLASAHAKLSNAMTESGKKFSRLIWISPEANFEDEKKRIFVERLRRELEHNEGAEIHQSPIEDFKMTILNTLLGLQKNDFFGTLSPTSASNKRSVYFMYDPIDRFEAEKVLNNLQWQEYEVILPSFNGKLLDLRKLYLDTLCRVDFAFIFLDRVNDLWVKMKYLDILKAPGLGRVKGQLPGAFVLGEKNKQRREFLRSMEMPVLEAGADLNKAIEQFIKEHTYVNT